MDELTPKELYNLFVIKKNQIKMMRRRGYDISAEEPLMNLSVNEIGKFANAYMAKARNDGTNFRKALTSHYEKQENGNLKRSVAYYASAKPTATTVGTSEVTEAVEFINRTQIHDIVMIIEKPLSPQAADDLSKLPAYNIQIFLEEEMMYDPTEHFLVPTHIPLTDDEQKIFIKNMSERSPGFVVDHLSYILPDDIISRYYGMREGQIFRIERENMFQTMVVKSVTYKLVKNFVNRR